MKRRDLTGQMFGRLTAERYLRSDKTDGSIWLCRCECGKEKEVPASRLIRGLPKAAVVWRKKGLTGTISLVKGSGGWLLRSFAIIMTSTKTAGDFAVTAGWKKLCRLLM